MPKRHCRLGISRYNADYTGSTDCKNQLYRWWVNSIRVVVRLLEQNVYMRNSIIQQQRNHSDNMAVFIYTQNT